MKSGPTFPKRVASIDIGTNTILLLIAEVDQGKLKPLFEAETVVRLGERLQKNGVLSDEAMKKGLQTLSQYLDQCQTLEVQKVFVVGTSALREAKNSGVFLTLVKERLKLSIEAISGEKEAQLSFLAVVKDLKDLKNATLVIDVGGGSTEFILGRADQIIEWVSLPLGIVHFTEQYLVSDPVKEEEYEKMEMEIRKLLPQIPHPKEPLSMVSIGGTGTTLASVEQGLEEYIPQKIHHFVLTREALKNQLFLYRSKTIEERKRIPGLPPSRADVILAGGAILYMTMEELKCSSVLVSCHGVRYGLIYKKLQISNCKSQIEKSKT